MGGKIRTSPDQQKVPLEGIADGLFGHCGVCGEEGPGESLRFAGSA
jgi:RNA polymerase-binding transcription factor DksA